MYCVCFQTKSWKTVNSFMHDRRMNVYGLKTQKSLELIDLTDTTNSSPFTQNFVTISSDSFEDSLSF